MPGEKGRGGGDPQREVRGLTLLKIIGKIVALQEADGWTPISKVVGSMKLYWIRGRVQSLRTEKAYEFFADLVQAGICDMEDYDELSEEPGGRIRVVKKEFLEKYGKKQKSDNVDFDFS